MINAVCSNRPRSREQLSHDQYSEQMDKAERERSGFQAIFGAGRVGSGRSRRRAAALDLTTITSPDPLGPTLSQAFDEVLAARPVANISRPTIYPANTARRRLGPSIPRLVGLVGPPQSGKDLVADYAAAHYADVRRLAYSDSIVDEVNVVLAPSGHQIGEGNKSVLIYRRLLQEWAMRRRADQADYWTKQVARAIERAWAEQAQLVIATGARDQHDYQLIRDYGGQVWKVIRPNSPYSAPHGIETALDHLGEDEFDEHLLNPVENNLGPYEANIRRLLDR